VVVAALPRSALVSEAVEAALAASVEGSLASVEGSLASVGKSAALAEVVADSADGKTLA
jgi:hypothetical protein